MNVTAIRVDVPVGVWVRVLRAWEWVLPFSHRIQGQNKRAGRTPSQGRHPCRFFAPQVVTRGTHQRLVPDRGVEGGNAKPAVSTQPFIGGGECCRWHASRGRHKRVRTDACSHACSGYKACMSKQSMQMQRCTARHMFRQTNNNNKNDTSERKERQRQ